MKMKRRHLRFAVRRASVGLPVAIMVTLRYSGQVAPASASAPTPRV
jgi:hypothetical protein